MQAHAEVTARPAQSALQGMHTSINIIHAKQFISSNVGRFMESFQYSELLELDGAFDDTGRLGAVDLWNFEGGSCRLDVIDLLPNDLDNWLHEKGKFTRPSNSVPNVISGLRLLLLLGHGPKDDDKLPLPTSKEVFDKTTTAFDLPRAFLQTLQRGTMAHYSVRTDSPDRIGFVLQTNGSLTGTFSLALSQDYTMRRTSGIVWAVDLNTASGLEDFTNTLRNAQSLIEFPLLVSSMFCNRKMELINEKIQLCKDTLVAIEGKTGIRRDDDDHGEADFEHLELGKVTRTLTSLTSKLAHNKYNCQLQQSIISFLQKTNACYPYSDTNGNSSVKRDIITERLAYLQEWIKFNQLRASYLSERADSQKQTVYSLIAQRDNALNLRIAKIMEHDGKEMKVIANITSNVAITTAKDSAAMKIIADLTMFFLPATFIATLFSSPFFEFGSETSDHGTRVSRLIWIYVVVTVALTALVRLIWYFSSKQRESSILKSYNDASRDAEKESVALKSVLLSVFGREKVKGA